MVLWVVAAAAGAGYAAKYFQQITAREREGSSESGYGVDGNNVLSLMNLSTTGVYGMEDFQETGYSEKGISSTDQETYHSQEAKLLSASSKSNAMLLFFLGITIGIMSTIAADQRKMEKSYEQAEKSEDLVQDYEELEITEMVNESELMNKIEVELEAELEKLELSMSTNTHPANYAVPPVELSLRLHEVIKSRLEARIMELEAALESSQQKMYFIESDREIYSESGTEKDRPIVMHLSGEVLDAYNEAYEEIHRMAETDDDISLELVHESGHVRKVRNLGNKRLSQGREYEIEDRISVYGSAEERWSRSMGSDDEFEEEEEEEEEEDDSDDEIEKLLIKIVEKTKQGSPVILDVQKMLYSMDHEW